MREVPFDSAKALMLEIFDVWTFVGSDDEIVVAEAMDVSLMSSWVELIYILNIDVIRKRLQSRRGLGSDESIDVNINRVYL